MIGAHDVGSKKEQIHDNRSTARSRPRRSAGQLLACSANSRFAMMGFRSGFVPIVTMTTKGGQRLWKAQGRRLVPWAVIVSTLLALAACDQFDRENVVDTCVVSALKHGEPFGNAKERAESEAQFREYCTKAAARKHM
jgi:hypothetical protein